MLTRNIYLAGPLFTLAERTFNEQLAAAIERLCPSITVVLPQREGAKLAGTADFSERMFRYSLAAIDCCDALVAVVDGADADSGTCVEIGYARAKGKPIVGIRTDPRACEDRGVNLMVANACSRLILGEQATHTLDGIAREIILAVTA